MGRNSKTYLALSLVPPAGLCFFDHGLVYTTPGLLVADGVYLSQSGGGSLLRT